LIVSVIERDQHKGIFGLSELYYSTSIYS